MKIDRAAIIHNDKIYTGDGKSRHGEIGIKMIKDGACKRPYPGGNAQGFVTEDGKFVDRETALMMAIRAGQVKAGETCHRRMLFSEDLY